MARQGKGIFDSFSGNIGEIQGSKVGTQGLIKSKNTKSVKTQTPELIKTKTNFQIALEFYELLMNSGWAPVFEKKLKGKTTKNLFIGEIIKLLSSKENGGKRFNPFVTTSNFWKWHSTETIRPTTVTLRIKTGYQPYPTTSLPSDTFCFMWYDETADDIVLLFEPTPNQRPTEIGLYSRTRTVTPGNRLFICMVFMNFDFKNIFNGFANFYRRPN